jgi:FkbM family methyltransferase
MMGKAGRLIEHIHRGTLLKRIQGEWTEQTQKRRNLRWETQNSKREYLETKIEHGLRMRLHLDSELARLIYCDDFERKERHFLTAFLRKGDVFVDVGANIGLFSLIAANRVGDSGVVYAFEPSKKTFYRLLENKKLNKLHNLQCFQLALSDESGESSFFISEDGFDAWNSIAHPIAGKSFSKEPIQCVTWDEFTRNHQLFGKVAMMKIDVEGWESRVLQGARESLSREDAPLLQVEFTEEASTSAGSSCEQLYHLLENLGYQMFVYDPEKRDLVPDPLKPSYPYQNLIAAKVPDKVQERLRDERPFKRFLKELNWR